MSWLVLLFLAIFGLSIFAVLPLWLIKTGIVLQSPDTPPFKHINPLTRHKLGYGYIVAAIAIWLGFTLSIMRLFISAPGLCLFSGLLSCLPLVVLVIYVSIVVLSSEIREK